MNKKDAMKITYELFPETCGDIGEIVKDALDDSIDTFTSRCTLNDIKDNTYEIIMERIPKEITIPFREAMADIIEELHDKIEELEGELYELKELKEEEIDKLNEELFHLKQENE